MKKAARLSVTELLEVAAMKGVLPPTGSAAASASASASASSAGPVALATTPACAAAAAPPAAVGVSRAEPAEDDPIEGFESDANEEALGRAGALGGVA